MLRYRVIYFGMWLLCIPLLLVFEFSYSHFAGQPLPTAAKFAYLAVFILFFAYTRMTISRQKCPSCGRAYGALFANSVVMRGKCPHCGAKVF